MKALGFGKEVEMKKSGKCPFCGKEITDKDFKNEISRKEFNISRLCQKCQDETFKE